MELFLRSVRRRDPHLLNALFVISFHGMKYIIIILFGLNLVGECWVIINIIIIHLHLLFYSRSSVQYGT